MNYYHKIKMQKKKKCIEQKYIRLILLKKKVTFQVSGHF